ncbi:hypothetical protein HMN09_00648700 [Mycena chlorophos]|uniref:Pentatricopeptide repeat-containing protein n=1 Tax=Mycena chlorophos TaxID=658473 RepID=A0A8H6T6D2_MYCCL|nr:hypothetical protein HMN09_00648700 [Mycena chlorophos]
MRRGVFHVARLTRSLHTARLEHLITPLRHPTDANAVRGHYLPLVAELDKNPTTDTVLTKDQLMTIVHMLATSGRPGDLTCIRSMCDHLPRYFGVPVTSELHTVVIRGLLSQGYLPLAQEWLRNIPNLPPNLPPTLEHYHTFLRSCPTHVASGHLREIVTQRMRLTGVRPTSETFSILFRCLIHNATVSKRHLHRDLVHDLIVDMKVLRITPDPAMLDPVFEYYVQDGFPGYAEELRATFDSHFSQALTADEQHQKVLRERLASVSSFQRALRMFTRLVTKGIATETTPELIRAILGSSPHLNDLRKVEEVLEVKADASAYAVLVNNSIRVKNLENGLAVYEAAKAAGIVPVAGLVAPLIRFLCSTSRKKAHVHSAHIDKALALYGDLDEAFPAPEPDSPEALAAQDPSMHSHGPDINIYTMLLRGVSLSMNVQAAREVGEVLLSDMKARNVSETQSIRTSKIVLELRSCKNLDAAYNVYSKARSELTETSYPIILHAFSRLSHSMGHPDLLVYYFQMVADMRQAGFRTFDRIYTDILQQFAEIAVIRKMRWKDQYPLRAPPPTLLSDLESAVRKVHNLASLDKSITPERLLWNQLMDTYQRLDLFAEAYRVWQTMFHAEKYGPISVNIILDACGYANEGQTARDIVHSLYQKGYVLSAHNWNSYIECLCRTQQFSRALEVLTNEMGTVAQPERPQISQLEIMVKLAESRIQTNTILQRVKKHLPDLWAQWEFLSQKGKSRRPEPGRPP